MEAFLPMGSRKWRQSMYPLVGKFSSNMRMRRISSVSWSRFRMTDGSVLSSSFSTRSAA